MDVVTSRWKVIQLPEREGITVTEVCLQCGISRKTYYKWRNRFQQEGIEGLKDRSRRPRKSPKQIDAVIESAIREIKAQYPRWGAYRIRNRLLQQGVTLSSKSVNTALKRQGIPTLWQKRRKTYKRFEREHSNSLWQMDIMGKVVINGVKVYPISVIDDCSRKILACSLFTRERDKEVVKTLTKVIEKYGSPLQIYTDNGGQFLSHKFSNLCSSEGIKHIKTSIAHPQGIGKIERWHRNVQEEFFDLNTSLTFEEAQPALDGYVDYYNHERPHMGISGCAPEVRYRERMPRDL